MNEILIIDIETTGFNHNSDCILEIGIVSLDLDSGKVEEEFSSMIKEKHLSGRHRNAWIFSNSDMTQDEVRNAPYPETVLKEVQRIIDRFPLGATAFNNKFDFGFLENRGITFTKKLGCPMLLSTDVCKIPGRRVGSYKWPNVEEAFKFFFPESEYVEKHRGLDDAKHEAAIVYELYKRGVFKIES